MCVRLRKKSKMPDSHLDAKHLHLRILALERDFSAQIAWCRECKSDVLGVLKRLSDENANFQKSVVEHRERVDALLNDFCSGTKCQK